MNGIRSLIGDGETEVGDETVFGHEYIPEPGSFLLGHDLLDGKRHVQFHQITAEIFEERSVSDMTFGYNLAKLNRDTRHTEAGYRYAVDSEDPSVLRAEFCPQSDTLTKGSFRAWNALSDRHEYDLVRVRVAETHQQSEAVTETLAEMERQYEETGDIEAVETDEEIPEPTIDQGTDPEAPF